MRWYHTDSLNQKRTKKDGQLQLLRLLGYTAPHFFIYHYHFNDAGDFLFPHRAIEWVLTENTAVFNMELVEPLKKKNKKLQALRSRFPNKPLMYNHRAHLPTGGLDDPNYVPAFSPEEFLLKKETGFNRAHLSYATAEANRMQARRRDIEHEEVRLWVGNPLHTLTKEFDCIDVLNKVRNMNGTPDKFPYTLSSFGEFLKLTHSGNVNLLMNPLDQSINWHIAAAKDSLFEGIFEWLEALHLLICPDSLDETEKTFFQQTAAHIPSVINGYNRLNKYLRQICTTKDFKKLNNYKRTSIMLDLLQNFPLKTSGKNRYERLQKLPPREVTSEFPDIFRKAFSLNNQQNKNKFQARSTTTPKGKVQITKREFQQYNDLKKGQNNRKRKRDEDRKKKNKRSRGTSPAPIKHID